MHVYHAYTKPARIQKKKSSPAGEYPNNLIYDKELQSHGIPQRRIAQKCIQMRIFQTLERWPYRSCRIH